MTQAGEGLGQVVAASTLGASTGEFVGCSVSCFDILQRYVAGAQGEKIRQRR